jgi:uncharacterized protein (DUF2062 family)
MSRNESHAVGKFSVMIAFAGLHTKTAELLCVCVYSVLILNDQIACHIPLGRLYYAPHQILTLTVVCP